MTLVDRFKILAAQLRDMPKVDMVAYRPPTAVDVFFAPNVTDGERNAVQAAISGFDWTLRRKRSVADISRDIRNLSAQDQNRILVAIMAEFLRENPRLAERLGIALPGDETF